MIFLTLSIVFLFLTFNSSPFVSILKKLPQTVVRIRIGLWIWIQAKSQCGSRPRSQKNVKDLVEIQIVNNQNYILCCLFPTSISVYFCYDLLFKKVLAFSSRNKFACSWIQIQEANLLRIHADLDMNHWPRGVYFDSKTMFIPPFLSENDIFSPSVAQVFQLLLGPFCLNSSLFWISLPIYFQFSLFFPPFFLFLSSFLLILLNFIPFYPPLFIFYPN